MRFLELRRHSKRERPNDHLSQEGVNLARELGEGIGPFALVITSPALRSVETAVAMGFAVTGYYHPVRFEPSEWDALEALVPEGTPFAQRAEAMRRDPLAIRYALALNKQWATLAASLPDGESALVISHGGYLDDSAVACLPDAEHAAWGPNFGHCEGIALAYDGERFVRGDILRVDGAGNG